MTRVHFTRRIVRRGRWSEGELVRLRELYGVRSEAAIARALGRPLPSVRKMAERLFRGSRRVGPWSADELQDLKRYLGITSPERIAKILRRSETEVLSKISFLGRSRHSGKWSREELQQLKNLYGSRSDEDLTRILGRSQDSIRRQAAALHLAKDKVFLNHLFGVPGQMPRWSDEELGSLRSLYPDHSNLEIARILGRSVKSIVSKAHDLDLKKDNERLQEMGRENVALRDDR